MSDWFQVGSNIGSTNTTTAISSDGSIMVVGNPNYNSDVGQVNVYQKSVITGEYEQLGSSIDGDVSNAEFGTSVAINPDGDIIAVGAPGADATTNYVRVYQYSGGSWSQLGSDITGSDELGFSVSISSDGTVLAIGKPSHNNSKGRALVYRYSSGSWNLEHTVTGSNLSDKLGNSVSLSDAGNILAIGIPGVNSDKGAVRVYGYSGSSWNLLKNGDSNVINHNNPTITDKFGDCVSVSGNGEVIGIATPYRSIQKGLVRMYQRVSSNWVQMTGNITGEANRDGNLGLSISLSYDGMTVAIGAQNNSSGKGHVRVYKFENDTWRNQIGSDIDSNVTNGKFGASVSISSDGAIVSVGSVGSSARVFEYGVEQSSTDNNLWVQLGDNITGTTGDYLGYSVSLSNNGTIAAVGEPYSGLIYVYEYSNDSWTQIGETIDWNINGTEDICVSISNDGTILAVGVGTSTNNGTLRGLTRIYKRDINISDNWIQLGDDIEGEGDNDESSSSVYLSGDGTTIAIGAKLNDDNGTSSGHVRIYKWSGSLWEKLGNNLNGEASGDQSGSSVSLSDDGTIVAVGAPKNDNILTNKGHVRVYQWDSSSWNQLGEDIDGEDVDDESGRSVSLSSDGTIVAIGSINNYVEQNYIAGHVRVYQYTNGSWTKIGQDIDGENALDEFGYSVSLSSNGDIIAIGAIKNADNGTDSGHVRIFKRDTDISDNWIKIGQDIDGINNDEKSGYSVSLSGDGKTVLIGSPFYSNGNGLVRIYKNIYTTDDQVETVINENEKFFDTKKLQVNNNNITNTHGNIFSTKNSSQKRIQRKFVSKGILKKHKDRLDAGVSIYAIPDTLGFTETELTEKTRFRIFNASASLNSSDSIPLDTEINVNDLPEGEGFHVVLENTSDTIKLIGTDNKFIEVTKTYKGQYYINKNDESNEIMDEGDTLDLYDIYFKLGSVSGGSSGQTPSSNICFIGSTLMQTDQGQEQISKLIPGFHTIDGKRIKFITETITKDTHLYKIKRNALGKNIPSREMTVTGNHLVEFDFVLIPVRVLSTELGKIEEIKYRGEKLYNILMDNHEIIKVNNLNVETLHPNNLIARLYNNDKFQNMEHEEKKQFIKKFNKRIQEEGLIKYE